MLNLFLAAGLSWWLTYFATSSALMAGPRERYRAFIRRATRMTNPESRLAGFLECPWCVGAWLSLGVHAAWWIAAGLPGTVMGLAAWFAVPAAAFTANTAWAGTLSVLHEMRARVDYALAQLTKLADAQRTPPETKAH